MGIKTVPRPPYSPDLAPCDFWLFPKLKEKLRGYRYEEVKEAVTKVIDTLTQEDFHGAFQKLLERYNKCIAAGGDYFTKKAWKLIVCSLYIVSDIFVLFCYMTLEMLSLNWLHWKSLCNVIVLILTCLFKNLAYFWLLIISEYGKKRKQAAWIYICWVWEVVALAHFCVSLKSAS